MAELTRLTRHSDARGHLVSVGASAEVPFSIRRVFWIYGNTARFTRAEHASRGTTQMLVCVAGSCRATLDGPAVSGTALLDRPDASLLVPPMTWLVLTEFSPDCVLLVLTDTLYDPADTISDLDHFRALAAP